MKLKNNVCFFPTISQGTSRDHSEFWLRKTALMDNIMQGIEIRKLFVLLCFELYFSVERKASTLFIGYGKNQLFFQVTKTSEEFYMVEPFKSHKQSQMKICENKCSHNVFVLADNTKIIQDFY